MRWSEINGEIWTIPAERSKNGRAHEVPLSAAVQSIIASAPKIAESDFVLIGRAGSFSAFDPTKKQIDAIARVEGWTFHDLRRTMIPSSSARDELVFHLRNGTIQSRAERSPTSSERQAGMEMALGPEFWQKAQILFVPDYKSGGGSFDVIGPAPVSNLWSVHLDRSAVMKTWPATSAAVQKPEPPSTKTKPKYGPQEEFDWEKCAIAVMLKCQQKGGPPAKVARLMEYAREWFGPDHEPGESQLRKHMTIIATVLKTGLPP